MRTLVPLLLTSALSLPAQTPSADAKILVEACNRFAADLQGRLDPKSGPTFAPGSIAIALWMLLPGARGATADEIATVLHLPADLRGERLHAAAGELVSALRTKPERKPGRKPDQTTVCELVNDAFVQQGFPLVPAYTKLLEGTFGATATPIDFATDPDAARQRINQHLQKLTHDRIRDLLSEDDVTADTRLVLTNALWCKGPWSHPFPADNTKPGPFTRTDGSVVEVPLMHVGAVVPWAEGPTWVAVSLPLAGRQFTVDCVLPKAGQPLAAAEQALFAGAVAAGLKPAQVSVTLPKFSVKQKHRLRDVLKAMGVKAAFVPGQADFTGLDATNSLVLHDVVHEAFVAADESGFEAAAATAVVMMRGGRPPAEHREFIADHPFAFALREVRTGLVLFVGRVEDPSAKVQ
jgi:serpin B